VKLRIEAIHALEDSVPSVYWTIRNYRRRVKQADELNEFAIAESMRGIFVQEQDHLIALATALGIDAPDPGIADEVLDWRSRLGQY
jgi:hypothetical protein